MLGVSFFIGIKASGPSKLKTAAEYYQTTQLPDGQVLSTMGLTDRDLEVLNAVEGVDAQGMQSVIQTLQPIDEGAKFLTYDGNEDHNMYHIVDGRMPEAVDEIVLDSKFLDQDNLQGLVQIGDKITVDQVEDYDSETEYTKGLTPIHFKQMEFEVVGFASTPIYMDRSDRGVQGNSVFAVVLEEALSGDFYSEAFFWTDASSEYAAYTEEYDQAMSHFMDEIESALSDHPQIRLEEMKLAISEELAQSQADLTDGQRIINETQTDLDNAQTELDDGWTQYYEGIEELQSGFEELQQGQSDFEEGLSAYQSGLEEMEAARSTLAEQELVYQDGLASYNQGVSDYENQINQAYDSLLTGQAEFDQGQTRLNETLAQLQAGQSELDSAREQLLIMINDLTTGGTGSENEIDDYILGQQAAGLHQELIRLSELRTELETNQTNLDEEYAELNESLSQLKIEYERLLKSLDIQVDTSGLSLEESITLYDQTLMDQMDLPPMSLEQLQTQLEEVQLEQESVEATLSQLQNEKAEIESAQATNTQNAETLATAQGELTSVNQLVIEAESAIQNYQVQIQTTQAQIETLSATEITPENEASIIEQMNNLNVTLNQLNTELVNTQTNLDTLYGRQAELSEQVTTLEAIEPLFVDEVRLAEINQSIETNQAALDELINQEAQIIQAIEDIQTNPSPSEPGPEIPETDLTELEEQLNTLRKAQEQLDAQQEELDAGFAAYGTGVTQLETARQELEAGRLALEAGEAAGLAELAAAEEHLLTGRQALDDAYLQLAEGESELADAQLQLSDAEGQLNEGLEEYQSGTDEAFKAYAQLEVGQRELEAGRKEFQDSLDDQFYDLRKGYYQIQEGYQSLEVMEEPNLVLNDRNGFSAYSSLKSNADQLTVISNFFPVIFFLVAILVTFTTIKRMVSEQRTYMGTMLQLGYTNGSIISKFAVYAGLSSILGIILGLISGYAIFPSIIINAYNNMYYLENIQIATSHFWNAVVTVIALLTALLPAVVQPMGILKTAPANLLLPEPPRSGKKVFLERIPALWNLLSFKKKMTVRNLLRYKGRNSMTLIGVAGCTMLMVTGFGISDTVTQMVEVQTSQIQTFDNFVYLAEDVDTQEVASQLAAIDGVETAYPVIQETVETDFSDRDQLAINLTVPLGDQDTFNDLVFLRERENPDTPVDLSDGPVMTERLAEHYDTSAPTNIAVRDLDHELYEVPIDSIVENYLGHYLYLTPEDHEAIFGVEATTPNLIFIENAVGADSAQVEKELSELESVATVVSMEYVNQQANSAMSSLNLITFVLLVAAAGLAFVVLYNLTNINIGERIKELSTIKVLGFYDKEVSFYIYDEILILTILGGLLGLGLGTVLTQVIMKTMQTPDFLFHPIIQMDGYIWSFVLTIVFSAVVMIVMHYKLKRIDVVEAMKAVE